MQLLVGIATLSFIAVAGIIGTRLLLLYRRTRQVPELSIGLAMFLVVFFGYPLSLASIRGGLDPSLATPVFIAGSISGALGSICIFVFTWSVFRKGEAWARGLMFVAAAVILALTAAGIPRVLGGASPAELYRDDLSMLRNAVYATGYLWTAIEAFRYYRMLQRRQSVGLGDPVVANRFLLWTLSGGSALIGLGVPISMVLTGGGAADLSPTAMLVVGVAGITSSVSTYLAFLPPEGYVRFVRGTAGTAA